MRMNDGFAGLTATQIQLVTYWRDCCGSAGFATRAAIDPGALRAFLACISVLDVRSGAGPVFRIAGSALRDILGVEARGRRLAELPREVADRWSLGLDVVHARRGPVGGIMEGAAGRHAWLRLPLCDLRGEIVQVLCHDELISQDGICALGAESGVPIPGIKDAFAA